MRQGLATRVEGLATRVEPLGTGHQGLATRVEGLGTGLQGLEAFAPDLGGGVQVLERPTQARGTRPQALGTSPQVLGTHCRDLATRVEPLGIDVQDPGTRVDLLDARPQALATQVVLLGATSQVLVTLIATLGVHLQDLAEVTGSLGASLQDLEPGSSPLEAAARVLERLAQAPGLGAQVLADSSQELGPLREDLGARRKKRTRKGRIRLVLRRTDRGRRRSGSPGPGRRVVHPSPPRERIEGAPMSDENPQRCTVRSGTLTEQTPPEAVKIATSVCSIGAGCAAVQASIVAKGALDELTAATATAAERMADKANAALAFAAAIKALDASLLDVRKKLKTYEVAVDGLAEGDGVLIAEAGLPTRPIKPTALALEPVKVVYFKKGTMPREAILSWPAAKGAGSYVVEVNFTSTDPNGPWTALLAAANQSRVVVAPEPGAQFLARVAAVSRDGKTTSEWSPLVLVFAR
jgi:hypothetical protein